MRVTNKTRFPGRVPTNLSSDDLDPVPVDVRKNRAFTASVAKSDILAMLVSSNKTRALCRVLAALPDDLDPLPVDVREKWGLMELRQAYRSLHAPKTGEEAEEARRRLVFDEFFYHQVRAGGQGQG